MPEQTFAENLRIARERSGLTRYALAQRSGVSEAMLHQYEAGNRLPSLPSARAIADALGVGIDELYPPAQPGRPSS